MKIKKFIIFVSCCSLFVLLSCNNNQPEKTEEVLPELETIVNEAMSEAARAKAEKGAAMYNAALEEIKAENAAAENYRKRLEEEMAAGALLKEKYGNKLQSASIRELVDNFDFSIHSVNEDFVIYNEKGKWHCEFPGGKEQPYLVLHEIVTWSSGFSYLIIYVLFKDNSAEKTEIEKELGSGWQSGLESDSGFAVCYREQLSKEDVIEYIFKDEYKMFFYPMKPHVLDEWFAIENLDVDEDKHFITASKIVNDNLEYQRNEDIEKLFANTAWITSDRGNLNYREFDSKFIKLAENCKYLVFEKEDDDIMVYYGYSDSPGKAAVYDHFAGRLCGAECSDGEYKFYINPITNIEQLINLTFVDDVADAVYGTDVFTITFKQGDVEGENKSDFIYVDFDENFETDETSETDDMKFVRYEKSDLLGDYNARVMDNYTHVYSSSFISEPEVTVLHEDDRIDLLYKIKRTDCYLSDDESWYYCQIRDGRCGWIFGGHVECAEMGTLPTREYTVHETNLKRREMPIDYNDFFGGLYISCEEERLGYPPVRETNAEYIVTASRHFARSCDGQISIGMDKSEIIKLLGKPIREEDEFSMEYCQELLGRDGDSLYCSFGTLYFNSSNKLIKVKVFNKI